MIVHLLSGTFDVRPLTLLASLNADAEADASPPPVNVTPDAWRSLHRLRQRVSCDGKALQMGDLLAMEEGDAMALLATAREMDANAESFRRKQEKWPAGTAARGEGDRVESRRAP